MTNVFSELHNKLKINYEKILKVSNKTNLLTDVALNFAQNNMQYASSMKVNWEYHNNSLIECEADFHEQLQALQNFTKKFANDLDRSRTAKTLATNKKFMETRMHSLNSSNDRCLKSVLERAGLWQLAIENALKYLQNKYDEKTIQEKTPKARLDLLNTMSDSIPLKLGEAELLFHNHQQEINQQWSLHAAPTKVARAIINDDEADTQNAGCFCCFFRKKPKSSTNACEQQPLLQKN